jgi:hypothetical protein
MIVCHRHRFIFVTTRKTYGASVERALAAFCDDGDIVSGADSANGTARAHGATVALSRYRPLDWVRLLARGQRAMLDRHLPAAQIRELVGEEVWNSYFKFCVERDPWQRAVALYDQRTRDLTPRPTLLEFLQHARRESLSNYSIYCIDAALAVDRVVRFEHLNAELDAIGQLLNLPAPLQLPARDNGAAMPHYSTRIGAPERALIDTACAREVELLGYAFREVAPEDR